MADIKILLQLSKLSLLNGSVFEKNDTPVNTARSYASSTCMATEVTTLLRDFQIYLYTIGTNFFSFVH